MFGPREMLLSSTEPVVRQFLNAQRIGPIGMAEEKDATELAAETGVLPPLPPIPPQLAPSNGVPRAAERPLGQWCREQGVTPPPGSFAGLSSAGRPSLVVVPGEGNPRPEFVVRDRERSPQLQADPRGGRVDPEDPWPGEVHQWPDR
jgi:hypothetical protein